MTDDETRRAMCDTVVQRAAVMMFEDASAPIPMIIDRFLTYAIAQACVISGTTSTAELLRDIAEKVEDGALDAAVVRSKQSH